ncbi:response regulator [Thermodesulfobacteriota bacterium]
MNDDTWKVLVIDDEAGIRKVISITLSDEGYQVLTAEDGETGIRMCREESPQIVITDIRMPGIDGVEVLKRIKEKMPEKEVIVITAFGEMEVAIRALQLDASDFITKPINNEALLIALERAKERYKTHKELREYTSLLEERWMKTASELAKTFDFQINLIESSIDGIIACDIHEKIITYNKSTEKMLGYHKNEVLGKMSFSQIFPVGSMERIKEEIYSDSFGGKYQLFLFETDMITKTGEKIPVQLSIKVLFEEKKEIGMVGFIRDLREVRRMEQQFADQTRLLHQHKMMSLGRLAASVVHEINNPLAGMLNYIRLMSKILNRETLDRERLTKFQGYLDIIKGEISRCAKIVSNLLAFSRKSKMEYGNVDINELLERCIILSRHKLVLQNIEIRSNFISKNPRIWGDINQLQQCAINLIFNALDAMPQGGTLLLENSFNSKEGVVEIKVSDNGCGIAKEELPHIFEPFYTTKVEGEGLGLGLSTVYGIIDRHKGTINVDSQLGKGTVFTIKIPVKPSNSSFTPV